MNEPAVKSVLHAGHVTRIDHDGREIYMVGTAHVSARSVAEVAKVIEEVRPDTVCVELDKTRFDTLVDSRRWHDLDVSKVLREGRVMYVLTALALSAFQRKIGDRLGVRPGAEMLAAIEAAKTVDAEVVLADRDIQATLRRTWHGLARRDRAQLALLLVYSPFAKHEEIGEARVEELKDGAAMSDMLEELAHVMPGLKRPLIDERDQYLVSMVREAPGKKIVAVVGAGHVKGMCAHIDSPVDRQALSELPPTSSFRRSLRWGLSGLGVGLSALAIARHSVPVVIPLATAWTVANAAGTGLFALLSGAKIPSLATAILVSPLTALLPLRNAGTLTGLVEARFRKQIPEDRENAVRDMMSRRGIYANGFTRVLLVAAATTFGSLLGTVAATVWVATLVR